MDHLTDDVPIYSAFIGFRCGQGIGVKVGQSYQSLGVNADGCGTRMKNADYVNDLVEHITYYERVMPAESSSNNEQLLRDRLAMDRTTLANERTLLAYLRTAIMLAATGGTLLSLYADEWLPALSGCLLVTIGIAVAAIGAARYRKLARSLESC